MNVENSHLKVEISELGAELASILGKKSGIEYLWQGDHAFWASRAPILFPICGRLIDGKYLYGEKEYQMGIHGFVKDSRLRVERHTKRSIVFSLRSDEKTLEIYPFEFEFLVEYKLKGATLVTNFTVKNVGKRDLYFSCGGHTGFNVPFAPHTEFHEYYLLFNKPKKCEKLLFNQANYFTGETAPFPLEKGRLLRLNHSLFERGPIFFKNMARTVTLKSDKSEKFVRMKYPKASYFGLWHTPNANAPFLCLEAWNGAPAVDNGDSRLENKLGIIRLKPNGKYKTRFDISLNE